MLFSAYQEYTWTSVLLSLPGLQGVYLYPRYSDLQPCSHILTSHIFLVFYYENDLHLVFISIYTMEENHARRREGWIKYNFSYFFSVNDSGGNVSWVRVACRNFICLMRRIAGLWWHLPASWGGAEVAAGQRAGRRATVVCIMKGKFGQVITDRKI